MALVNQDPHQCRNRQQENPLECSSEQQAFGGHGWSKIKWYAGRNDARIVRSGAPKVQKAGSNRNDYSRVFENFSGSICTVHAQT